MRPWPPRSPVITGDDLIAVGGACLSGVYKALLRLPLTAVDARVDLHLSTGQRGYVDRAAGLTGNGNGDGYGYGDGDGDGYGYGYGYGDGDGYGYGYGDGDGYGYGYGYGYGSR